MQSDEPVEARCGAAKTATLTMLAHGKPKHEDGDGREVVGARADLVARDEVDALDAAVEVAVAAVPDRQARVEVVRRVLGDVAAEDGAGAEGGQRARAREAERAQLRRRR